MIFFIFSLFISRSEFFLLIFILHTLFFLIISSLWISFSFSPTSGEKALFFDRKVQERRPWSLLLPQSWWLWIRFQTCGREYFRIHQGKDKQRREAPLILVFVSFVLDSFFSHFTLWILSSWLFCEINEFSYDAKGPDWRIETKPSGTGFWSLSQQIVSLKKNIHIETLTEWKNRLNPKQ